MYNFIKRVIEEGKSHEPLKQITLDYDRKELDPALSKDALDYHFGKLYKAYVDRYNKVEGDLDFNEAGAFLHSIYFSQFQEYNSGNKPTETSAEFIEKHHGSWNKFKESFEETAMKIQGSGWVYLAKDGKIKTIVNHEIKNDIILLIDWWEHAWALDYQADKAGYLANQWKIINWETINTRLMPISK